ncbi:MAG: DUF45 domain-containing protein [Acidobacteriota bacterium]|nr:DUF45 domain-containing protein [Acidobacteriota bacterium]MDH3784263.1 DUF45 domain-containing protein [Acidobacteriota bacterium]
MPRKDLGSPGLFKEFEGSLQPSIQARLRAMARQPVRAATTHGQVKIEQDIETMEKLRRWAEDLATHFSLRYSAIEKERDDAHGHYGICYADGVIRIRLRHARTGRLLKESSLADTLCHELAHLRHFDHSIRFRRFYRRILDRARLLGYYRPGPNRRPTPMHQGLLFE